MSKIITWIKTHILILVLIGVVLVIGIFIIHHHFRDKEDKETDKQTKKESQMICSTTYEDGEKVELEFVYENNDLKKLRLLHSEIGLTSEDEMTCKQYNTLTGISCDFDKAREQYQIIFNIDEFDKKSLRMFNQNETFHYFLKHSMNKTKKYLKDNDDYPGMVCKEKN